MSEPAVAAGAASAVPIGRPTTSATLPFVRGDDAGFPVTGALLLLALLIVAAGAWWKGSRRAPQILAGAFSRNGWWASPTPAVGASARVLGSTRLGPGAALHVVEWRGAQVLVAINGSSEPVVIGRHPVIASTSGSALP